MLTVTEKLVYKGKSSISPLTAENYKPVAVFLEKTTNGIFKKEFWLDRFEYWWDKNPAMTNHINRGWVLRVEDGEIGGFLGNIPVRYYIKGQEKVVCCVTSWYVGEEYRKRSIELLIPFIKQKVPALLLDTTPIEKVANMLLKLGFNNIEKEWLRKDALYPVDIAEFWDFIAMRYGPKNGIAASIKLAGLFVIPAVKFYQAVRKFSLSAIGHEYTFSEIRAFDKSYSLLWDKLKERYDMLAVRNETTLNWFFFGSKDMLSSRKVIELRYDDEIIGYVAVKEVEHTLHGKAYCCLEVVDMVILNNQPSAYDIALRGLLWLAKNSEKKVVFVLMNPFVNNIRQSLLRHGFFIKRGKSKFLYKPTSDDADLNKSFNEGYYATPLDGDRCFFP